MLKLLHSDLVLGHDRDARTLRALSKDCPVLAAHQDVFGQETTSGGPSKCPSKCSSKCPCKRLWALQGSLLDSLPGSSCVWSGPPGFAPDSRLQTPSYQAQGCQAQGCQAQGCQARKGSCKTGRSRHQDIPQDIPRTSPGHPQDSPRTAPGQPRTAPGQHQGSPGQPQDSTRTSPG